MRPESIIQKFFEHGSISKPIFSLYFADDFETSYMVIGGYD